MLVQHVAGTIERSFPVMVYYRQQLQSHSKVLGWAALIRQLLVLTLQLVIITFYLPKAQAQQGNVDTVATSGGTCSNVIVANSNSGCVLGSDGTESGVIYTHIDNGTVLITVGLNSTTVLSFVGEKDSQPNPGDYVLYLSRIRLNSNETSTVANVSGTCTIRMSSDGSIWYSVVCSALGENYTRYELDFISDGRPIVVTHPTQQSENSQPEEIGKINDAMIKEVASEFKGDLTSGGMNLVTRSIQNCYDTTSFEKTVENSRAVTACMLYDTSAFEFDKGWRTGIIARGGNDPGPVTPYLSPQAFEARMEIYSQIPFDGSVSDAESALSQASNAVLNEMN